jgi:hypothetical protein
MFDQIIAHQNSSSFLGVLPCVFVSGSSHKPLALYCANLGHPYVLDMRLECPKLVVSAAYHSVDIDLPIERIIQSCG